MTLIKYEYPNYTFFRSKHYKLIRVLQRLTIRIVFRFVSLILNDSLIMRQLIELVYLARFNEPIRFVIGYVVTIKS